MKAWEIAKNIVDTAEAKIVIEDEKAWTMDELQSHDISKLRTIWRSIAPGSGAPSSLIAGAIQSMENMGQKVEEAEILLEKGFLAYDENHSENLFKITMDIFRCLNNSEKDEDSDYWNFTIYGSFEEFIKKCDVPKRVEIDVNTDSFYKKLYNSWIGQIAGGAFGTAIEGYSRENIKKSFEKVTSYLKKPSTYNDDITYELAFLLAILEKGKNITSYDIAREWIGRVPFGWSAEDIALKNLMLGIMPPESGYLNNPYREWIGAQMRGAICGMIAPGDPYEAARLAWIDGEISHHNGGIIGEVFNSVLTSLAFVEKDMRNVLETAINMLPKDCQYYDVVKFALEVSKQSKNYEEALIICEEKFKKYNLTHAFPNAAIEVVALWFSEGDFDITMEIGAMAGLDVDCNTAQLGAIIGAFMRDDICNKWTEPIGDTLLTYVRGLEKLSIKELTDLTLEAIGLFK